MVFKTAGAQQPKFFSLRIKLLIGFTMVFSGVFAAAYWWFYTYATEKAMQRIQEDLVETLNGAIAGVNGTDFAALAKIEVPAGQTVPSNNRLYQQHQDWLNKVHTIEPRANPYTFVVGVKPYEVLWIGDIFRVIRPASQTAFRESYDADPANTNLYSGLTELTVTTEPYSDEWGKWISAYGPLKNSSGQIVGGMGIDFQANYVFEVQRGIRNTMLISFAITYTSLFILVYIISGIVTKPIVGLTKAAEQIGEGDYGQNLSLFQQRQFNDEISSLADVFEIMISKVRQREENLKQQVAELKIEIDQTKRQKQVKEIVDTDFFQDLQAKARLIRSRGRAVAHEEPGSEATSQA